MHDYDELRGIVTRLAEISVDDISEGGVVGGRVWGRCKLCRGSEQHKDDCPWLGAKLWELEQTKIRGEG